MPRTARLRIDDYKSETEVDNLTADLEVKTYKGSVRVRGLTGALRVETYKGDVRAQLDRLDQRSSVDTYKGNVELELPRASGFDLRADLGKKTRFDSDFGATSARSFRRRQEFVREAVNGGGPELRVKSYKGSIQLSER
jgi:hypothetical protein